MTTLLPQPNIMYKKHLFFIILITAQIAIPTATAQVINWTDAPKNPIVKKYTRNHFHLYGPVEVLKTLGLFGIDEYTFSADGLLLKDQRNRHDNYVYKNGKPVMRINISDTIFYINNAAGQLITERFKQKDITSYTYTKSGQLAEENKIDVGKKEKYVYDEKNRLKQHSIYDINGNLTYIEEYTYSTTKEKMLKILSKTKMPKKNETMDSTAWVYNIALYSLQGVETERSNGGDTNRLYATRIVYDYMGNKMTEIVGDKPSFQTAIKYFTDQLPTKETVGCIGGNCINGYGQYKYKDKEYLGFFKNGEPSGFGTMTYKDKSTHSGNWQYGIKEGYGMFTLPNGKYKIGIYQNDVPDGYLEDYTGAMPKYELYSKNKFIKEFKFLKNDSTNRCQYGDCKDGYGIFIYENGNQFKGFFKNGNAKMGMINFKNGDVYQGNFNEEGEFEGVGIYQFKTGDRYIGKWHLSKYSEGGSIFSKANNSNSTGWYVNGLKSYDL